MNIKYITGLGDTFGTEFTTETEFATETTEIMPTKILNIQLKCKCEPRAGAPDSQPVRICATPQRRKPRENETLVAPFVGEISGVAN